MAAPASPALSFSSSTAPQLEGDTLDVSDFLVGFGTADGSLFDGPPTPREAPHELPAVTMSDSIDADVFRCVIASIVFGTHWPLHAGSAGWFDTNADTHSMYMDDGLLDKLGQPAVAPTIAPTPTAIDPSLFAARVSPPAPVVVDTAAALEDAMDEDDDRDDFGGEYREDGDDSDAAPKTRKGKAKAAARKPAAPRKSARSTRASSSAAKGVAALAIPTDQASYVPTEGSNRLPHIAFSAPDWIDKPSAVRLHCLSPL